ncbi:Site-specific recombinase XerD [Zunongwangia mangrovi]|uniref:Site-specific recombinase XerD n=1 Tax=Zunongwangia mangrovi TaxID=1334022 RepID=A0A1I1HS45_9FLAO|nr:site-specific integrase [Zunongwangia mangrovi]SFC26959.1 Site-specific recombinase XerD [Zunongwangia mangrovi]
MRCKFYLDRPYNPEIDNNIIKKEKKYADEKRKKLAVKFFNPKPTSVYIYFSPDKNTRLKYRTSIKLLAKDWDFTKGRVRTSSSDALHINIELDKLSSKIVKEAYLALERNKFLSKNDYKLLLTSKVDEDKLESNSSKLDNLISEFKKYKRLYATSGTMQEYKTVFKALAEYQEREKTQLSLLDFNKDFYISFENYLSFKNNPLKDEPGLLNDTIYKYISTLRAFLKWCHSNGENVHPYTFEKHNSAFKKKTYNEIVVLNLEEIKKLEELDLKNQPSFDRVRDLFLLMIYTAQRFSDIMKFSKSDFQDNKWTFVSAKTKKMTVVPFNGYIANGLRLLEKYDYELPKISNQKFNEYLKKIGKLAEINSDVKIVRFRGKEEVVIKKPKYKFMSSHMGRRTAVTILLSKGIPIPLIQKLTQHSDIRTLMKYNSTSMDSLISALNEL